MKEIPSLQAAYDAIHDEQTTTTPAMSYLSYGVELGCQLGFWVSVSRPFLQAQIQVCLLRLL